MGGRQLKGQVKKKKGYSMHYENETRNTRRECCLQEYNLNTDIDR